MSLLVTGSIGIDTVETPHGKRDDVIGGSAIYFSYAASFFTPVRLVGVVGEDAPKKIFDVFHSRDVDTSGLEVRKGSKTFRWHGSYVKDLNDFAKLNAVYGTYFKDKPPARATVQVQRLPKDAAVEISAIAVH